MFKIKRYASPGAIYIYIGTHELVMTYKKSCNTWIIVVLYSWPKGGHKNENAKKTCKAYNSRTCTNYCDVISGTME